MASVGPRTGGIKKSSNTEVTKLDFNIVDLAPALNGRSEGEDKATVIENFRKHYDGSYVKRAGTKSMLDLKKIIIDDIGEWGWNNFNTADTFTDRYNDEVHEMIIMLIDGQPYVKEIMGGDTIRRIPLLIYDEFNEKPIKENYINYLNLSYKDYDGNICFDSYKDPVFIYGAGNIFNYEVPIQGVHHVFFDKVFTKFVGESTEELYKGTVYDWQITNGAWTGDDKLEGQHFINRSYKGWNNINNIKLETYKVKGKLYVAIENRMFELNIGSKTLKQEKMLTTPWVYAVEIRDNITPTPKSKRPFFGLDSIYYRHDLNSDTDLWSDDTIIDGEKHYYLVEVPHMVVPSDIYMSGIKNYNSNSPNTATPFFNRKSKAPSFIDYTIGGHDNQDPIVKTFQQYYKTNIEFPEEFDYIIDDEYTITDVDFNLSGNFGIYSKNVSLNKNTNKIMISDIYSNNSDGIIKNRAKVGNITLNNNTNTLHINIKVNIQEFITKLIHNIIGLDKNVEQDDVFTMIVSLETSKGKGFATVIDDDMLLQILNIDMNDLLFDDDAYDDLTKINSYLFKKLSDEDAHVSVAPMFLLGIYGFLEINIEYNITNKTATLEGITNFYWQSLKGLNKRKDDWGDKQLSDEYDYDPEFVRAYGPNLRLRGVEPLYKNEFGLEPNTFILDYNNGTNSGLSLLPVYSGQGFYGGNIGEVDYILFRHFNLNRDYFFGTRGIWNWSNDGDITEEYVREDFKKYSFVIETDISFSIKGTPNPAALYDLFSNIFQLSDTIDWIVPFGVVPSPPGLGSIEQNDYIDTNSTGNWGFESVYDGEQDVQNDCVINVDECTEPSFNMLNGSDFVNPQINPLDINDSGGINTSNAFIFLVSIPSSMGIVEERSIKENPDPTLKYDEGRPSGYSPSDYYALPYQYSTVSWNFKRIKPIFQELIISSFSNIDQTKSAYYNGIQMSGDIVKIMEIKGRLVIVKKHTIYIDMYHKYIFNYMLQVDEGDITDVFMYQGNLYVSLSNGNLLTYDIKDDGVVDGLTITYKDSSVLSGSINGDIKAISSGSEFIYLITDSGIYDIYSISFNGATPTIKTRLLSGILEPYILDDIRDASNYNIIISGESVFFILKDIKRDDGTLTSKVYIRDKIQSKYYWSVYVGDVWNIRKMINMIDSKNRFIFLTDDYQVLDFGYEEKIFPNLDNSPTEQIFLDKYIIDETGTPQGDGYSAVIKTNLINMSSPYDVSVNKIWVKLNFINKKSLVTTNVSYMKNGELYRNNKKSVNLTRKDGTRLTQSISNKIENNISSTRKHLNTRKTRVKNSTFISKRLKNYVDNKRNTDKWFETITDENIEIKNSSFVTSGYSVEFSHNANAPMEFRGLIVEQKRKDKVLK